MNDEIQKLNRAIKLAKLATFVIIPVVTIIIYVL